jgi:hypothetical protein
MAKARGKPRRSKQPRHQRQTAALTAGWEIQFRKAFDSLFEPAVARLDQIIGERLTSTQYYGVVAILHDLAQAHAETLTGTRKPRRSQQTRL